MTGSFEYFSKKLAISENDKNAYKWSKYGQNSAK